LHKGWETADAHLTGNIQIENAPVRWKMSGAIGALQKKSPGSAYNFN